MPEQEYFSADHYRKQLEKPRIAPAQAAENKLWADKHSFDANMNRAWREQQPNNAFNATLNKSVLSHNKTLQE